MRRRVLKSKRLTRTAPSTRRRSDSFHIVVAVHVPQVGQVYSVLRRLLGMAGKSEAAEFHAAPLASIRRLLRKAPLRRASIDAPPGEDEAQDFTRVEDLQPGGFGRLGIGRCNAGAGYIVGEAVKGADEMAIPYASAGRRTQ